MKAEKRFASFTKTFSLFFLLKWVFSLLRKCVKNFPLDHRVQAVKDSLDTKCWKNILCTGKQGRLLS